MSTYLTQYSPIECECQKTYKLVDEIVQQSYELLHAYICDECQYICDHECNMKIHILSEHTPDNFISCGTEYAECPSCGTQVHYDMIKDHVKLHYAFVFVGRDPIYCQYCHWKNDIMANKSSCYLTHERIRRAHEHMLEHKL